jgi:nicotinate-nucleotide adenylyltransferase
VVALEVLEGARLERLIVVPAWHAPHKARGPVLEGPRRLELLRVAFAGLDRIEVDDLELRRRTVSYTVETLRAFQARHPQDELGFIIGADSLPDLPGWRDAGELGRLATFLVAVRPGSEAASTLSATWRIPGLRLEAVPTTPIGISSTQVRSRIARGLPLAGFVPDAVAERLAAAGWYRDRGSPDARPAV